MAKYFDVFNGDADGICALLQLRLESSQPSVKVSGVERDIALLSQVDAGPGDVVTVLDISFDKNRKAVESLLGAGADIFYVDHHFAGDIPEHPRLTTLINPAPELTTSALVNGHLKGARAGWAVVGCFGDNMDATAQSIAATLPDQPDLEVWKQLGVLMNYNGYGASVDDLHFAPDELFERLLQFPDPDACLNEDPDLLAALSAAYDDDMTQALEAPVCFRSEAVSVIALPGDSWARRVSGVFGNHLANTAPDKAHAVLTDLGNGYLVSVRAPIARREGADAVCRQFATGGGRAAAAGVNHLPYDDLERFIDAMTAQYGSA